MAWTASDDSLDSEVLFLNNSVNINDRYINVCDDGNDILIESKSNLNIVHKITNRQLYGRITRHPKANTEPMFNNIYYKCRYRLNEIIPESAVSSDVFMGFTLCGNFFISYTTKLEEFQSDPIFPALEYELRIWRFVPGQKLIYLTKHRIFKFCKSTIALDDITFMQLPLDPYKIFCYGVAGGNPSMSFLTILTLPIKNCRNCREKPAHIPAAGDLIKGWCLKHGFMLHFTFTMAQPAPSFNPYVSLAYPDHIIINTGHCIHILNVSTLEPPATEFVFQEKKYDIKIVSKFATVNYIDSLSDACESPSEVTVDNTIIDPVEDFNEYDLEGNDHNKPFHELNISCEPLNVTGKNYHNVLVQNIVDTRLKHLQNSSKEYLFSVPQNSGYQKQEKSKVDKKVAEKAYEFTEDNEKCEKLSLFRKKRLADKKYEFSEDNSENIVPFYSLRRERRFFYRTQNYCLRSPEVSSSLFLSPRSPGMRSPMQSPNSRNGQFSPGGARNIYCPVIRTHPHYSKSPISPKESTRKFNVYSPGFDSDCSDSDSRLILRQVHNVYTSHFEDPKGQGSLLIVDPKRDETPKWIKKVVKRYSSIDYENASLLSGNSRDDYNVQFEIPLLVQTLTEQPLDVLTEFHADQLSETQFIVTQRTCDCDQFAQNRAQKLCSDAQLDFLHCEDYEMKILHICPLNGVIVCKSVIKICALQTPAQYYRRNTYIAEFLFTWNIASNSFQIIEPPIKFKLQSEWCSVKMPLLKIPSVVHRKVLVMTHHHNDESKQSLRDYNNCYEICMVHRSWSRSDDVLELSDTYTLPSDSDY